MLHMVFTYLNPVNKNQAKIRNDDREFVKQLNFKGVKFPAHKKKITQKLKNDIYINVFGCENTTQHCSCTSKQTFKKHVDLLLISNTKNLHLFIKDFNRPMINKTKHHGKNNFINIAYNASLAQE